jgi:hypothetical protein
VRASVQYVHAVRKIVLELVPGVEMQFMDRGRALAKIGLKEHEAPRHPIKLWMPSAAGSRHA